MLCTSLFPHDITLIPLLLGLKLISPPVIRIGCKKFRGEGKGYALAVLELRHSFINLAHEVGLLRHAFT